ncbi:MAG: c-type cytochrome [Bradymonadaceae bacterium]
MMRHCPRVARRLTGSQRSLLCANIRFPCPTQPVILYGQDLYERACMTCHGKTGDGRGLEQELFGFGAPVEAWTHTPSVEGILLTLHDGIHETSMQAFPDFHEAERQAVALYVLELREELSKPEPQ